MATVAISSSWTEILAEHARWLRTVVTSRVDPSAVDDVMQEIGLAVHKALDRAQNALDAAPRAWAPWLYRVAVRQTLLYRRRVGRQRRLVDAYAAKVEGPRVGDDPLAWLLREERHDLVRRAIARLPPRDAQTLLLKYAEGWSYSQIAERLGVTSKAVEARLARARDKLRATLSNSLDSP